MASIWRKRARCRRSAYGWGISYWESSVTGSSAKCCGTRVKSEIRISKSETNPKVELPFVVSLNSLSKFNIDNEFKETTNVERLNYASRRIQIRFGFRDSYFGFIDLVPTVNARVESRDSRANYRRLIMRNFLLGCIVGAVTLYA